MGSEKKKDYSIEARQLGILGAAGHDFWALKDGEGNIVSELHGLATRQSTGEVVPIGWKQEDLLQAYTAPRNKQFVEMLPHTLVQEWEQAGSPHYTQDDQPNKTVYSGPDALERWQAAVNAIPAINDKKIEYPFLGGLSTLYGILFGVGEPTNSNSVYSTFGKIMGARIHHQKKSKTSLVLINQ